MMRRLLLALLTLLAFAGASPARDAGTVKVAQVGKVLLLKLPGNREAGYRWRLNRAESRGLDLVTVKDVGWTIYPKRSSIFFARKPSLMSIAVIPKAPGEADLAFDYYRFWGNRLQIRTERVRVVINPAPESAR